MISKKDKARMVRANKKATNDLILAVCRYSRIITGYKILREKFEKLSV